MPVQGVEQKRPNDREGIVQALDMIFSAQVYVANAHSTFVNRGAGGRRLKPKPQCEDPIHRYPIRSAARNAAEQ
jgi:hypothetical protein